MAIIQGGSNTANTANVDANNNLKTTLPLVGAQAGYVRTLSEVDYGYVTGSSLLLAAEVSEDFKARVEIDNLKGWDDFNYVSQDTGKYIFRTTTMTGTWGGGSFNTNASAITTTGTGCQLLTRQYFPTFGSAQTNAYFKVAFTGTWAVTNKIIDIGLMTGNTTTPYAPTDGVFFRATSAGFFGVLSVNGVEVTTTPFVTVFNGAAWIPTIGTFYDCLVSIGENYAVWWMNLRDGNGYVMMGRIITPIGSGTTTYSNALQFGIRDANTGTTSAVQSAKIVRWTVTQGGPNLAIPINELASLAGLSGGQGQQGATMGSTALYTNSLAPGAGAVMTNTTAALGSGLGGQFTALPTLAVNTDGIICSFQNPVPTTSIPGKALVIDAIKISSIVTTVLAGNATPVIYAYSAAWGHDAVSLATAEAATTKAPRRKALGTQQFAAAAAVGVTGGTDVYMPITDIVVQPGEFFQIVGKNIGVVTTTGAVTFFITINSHWVV